MLITICTVHSAETATASWCTRIYQYSKRECLYITMLLERTYHATCKHHVVNVIVWNRTVNRYLYYSYTDNMQSPKRKPLGQAVNVCWSCSAIQRCLCEIRSLIFHRSANIRCCCSTGLQCRVATLSCEAVHGCSPVQLHDPVRVCTCRRFIRWSCLGSHPYVQLLDYCSAAYDVLVDAVQHSTTHIKPISAVWVARLFVITANTHTICCS